jgi:Protein of unknown function (DUF726)
MGSGYLYECDECHGDGEDHEGDECELCGGYAYIPCDDPVEDDDEEDKTEDSEGDEQQYCSWCNEFSNHELVERNRLVRNDYHCEYCGNSTVMCRVPTCHHMATAEPKEESDDGLWHSLRESWSSEFCAEHDGSIPGFQNLGLKLNGLEEWELLFERQSINFKKIGTVAGGLIGGAAVFGPLAFLAAPGLASALGSAGMLGAAGTGTAIKTLTGVALANASMAAIGGGTVAAGGFGMAGGAILVTAAGSALGARQGAVVSNNYYGSVKDFSIDKVNSGKGTGLVFINGFLSQKKDNTPEWRRAAEPFFDVNPWYQTNWESKSLYDIGSLIGKGVGGKAFAEFMKKLAARAARKAGSKLSPLNWAATISEIFGNPWHSAMVKAAMTGIMLADIIARTKHRSGFNIMAHSLGCRVTYYMLNALSTKDRQYIRNVYLLGGAVDRKDTKGWKAAASAVKGRIFNCYSKNDDVLRFLYQPANAFISDPIGLGPITTRHQSIRNINVTRFVGGHMQYKENFGAIMRAISKK